jgi:chemotaxis response regulator CheB
MRIAIVNDMMLAVEAMRRVLAQAKNDRLAWIARDGAEAVELCAADTPDLILMDLIMPVMDGVEATRRIMANSPCAVVVVTANVDTNSSKVFEALGAGALDAVNTPVLESNANGPAGITLLAKIETIRKIIGPGINKKSPLHPGPVLGAAASSRPSLIAIGASAGGPAALAKILGSLPADFPGAIVVVQHVDVQFVQGLANWLDSQTRLHVRLAAEGDRPQPGIVLLAAREDHLIFADANTLGYSPLPQECSYRPSVDVFFKSASRCWPGEIVGVLLTGMGRDGAEGLLELRRAYHATIAQDHASSAVFGMPKAAVELDAAREILALDKIGPRLTNILAQKLKPHG